MNEDTHSIVPNRQSSIVNRQSPPPVVDAEWVQGYRPRRIGRWRHWLGALGKLIIGCGVAVFLLNLPTLLQTWKNPVVIFLFVCFIGKLMYDTFFYDHFQF
jgi:hypothetical protein